MGQGKGVNYTNTVMWTGQQHFISTVNLQGLCKLVPKEDF